MTKKYGYEAAELKTVEEQSTQPLQPLQGIQAALLPLSMGRSSSISPHNRHHRFPGEEVGQKLKLALSLFCIWSLGEAASEAGLKRQGKETAIFMCPIYRR